MLAFLAPLPVAVVHCARDQSHADVTYNAVDGAVNKRNGPPSMPYVLRGHRLLTETENSEWWVRRDHNEQAGPLSRRSLDSTVYRIFKSDEGTRQNDRSAWWLQDIFTGNDDGDGSDASKVSSEGTSSNEGDPRPGNPIPVPNIDATPFAPSYIPPVDQIEREFMVVSGGFTDADWVSFPVWAFDLNASSHDETNWRDLSGLGVGRSSPPSTANEVDPTKNMVWPPGRVGHVSSIHEGDLYIFGGMLWKDKNFIVEEAPYVWRARVEHKLEAIQSSFNETSSLEWERIIPTIRYYHDVNVTNDGRQKGHELELTRGECRGGHWKEGSGLVFYGGLHVKHQLEGRSRDYQEDVALGDIWMYNYTSRTLEQLSPYPPPESQRDQWGRYPVARTAHAATIVGNSLFVYGGMTSSAWSATRGNEGIGVWDELSDIWVFDLIERKWTERFMTPELSRSYHSMVGWGDGSLGVFGGFRTARTISGEPIAFVFSDTLVSKPKGLAWWKAELPDDTIRYDLSASNRLEHTAAVDKYGSMYVWGGRFKTVNQIHGMWSIDVFNADTNVTFGPAPPDGLEEYEAELEALHMLVAVMLLMSVLFTALYGTLRRQAIENEGAGNGNAMGILGRRRGLTREAINALPTKTFGAANSSPAQDAVVEHVRASEPLSDVAVEEQECCPICLVEYEPGDELRTLPCNHEFHTECVDAWLENHTSCPACRHTLSNFPESARGESEGIWRISHGENTVSAAPTVTFTQLIGGNEVALFRNTSGQDSSNQVSSDAPTIEEPDNEHEAEQDIATGATRRFFGFTRYFSLPQMRASENYNETLGDTEMTTIESSPRRSTEVV